MMDEDETSADSRLNSISQVIAAIVVLAGVLVLISWLFRLPGLNRLHPAIGGMNAHAALCFTLAGTGLWLLRKNKPGGWKRHTAHAAASVVVIISVLTLSAWYGWGFGIDQVVPGVVGQVFPGRMPVATALAFLAFGLALLLLDVEVWQYRPTEFLSFAAMLISLLALVAYGFAFVSVFDIPNRRSLAFHTVLLLLLFSFGILAARPREGLMRLATDSSMAGVMTRRLLPAAVGIPVLVGWLITEGQRGGLYPSVLNVAYYAVSIVVVFSTLIWLTAISLNRLDIRRQMAEDHIRRLNAELEQRVLERTAQLENVNKELEAFSYSVSHDLRAPLRHIDGFSQLLLDNHTQSLEPSGRRYLTTIRDATRTMGRMIDDLLNMARIERRDLVRQDTDLNLIVKAAIDDLHHDIGARTIDWQIATLPRLSCDPGLIKLVFSNLLSNAVKYTRNRERAVIQIGQRRGTAPAVIMIADNGAGFDQRYAHKLFGVFQRLHRSEEFEGTGVGLATVQRIVRKHGGEIWAEAAVDRGATFFFTLGGETRFSSPRIGP